MKMRSQCMKLVRQRNQAGGVKFSQLRIKSRILSIKNNGYLMMLLVMRNSAQLMISLGK